MKIFPVAYDSFSTRSMATLVETDITIFIDPSIAIAPRRYGLKPHPLEIEELEKKKRLILNLGKYADYIIITHYHWDHCPHPKEKHFEVLYNKKIFIKNFMEKINKSQQNRGKKVYSLIKDKSEVIFSDGKEFEIENTLIKFSKPVWHGIKDTKLGFLLMVYIEYKNTSLLYGSDIQGVLTEETKNIILEFDPEIFILSGPATYHKFWTNELTNISNKNLYDIIEKTKVKVIILDHHLVRDINYKEKIKNLLEFANQFDIKIKTAAEFLGIKNKFLEARRKELYKNNST